MSLYRTRIRSVLVLMSISVILNLKFTSNMLKKSIKKHDSMGDKFRIQKKRFYGLLI